RIILETDQDKSGMLVSILESIAKAKGRNLPNFVEIRAGKIEEGSNLTHVFEILCPSGLEEKDLTFSRQLLIERGGESPSAINRSLRIKTKLENMGSALLEFARCLGKQGINIDSYQARLEDSAGFEVEFIVTPPAALAMEPLDHIKLLLSETIKRQIGFDLNNNGRTSLPGDFWLEEILLEVENHKVGSAGSIVRKEDRITIESETLDPGIQTTSSD
ncbi:MAG: hypothetical protein GYA55_09125, partial [SAR324 cluster bacterium]|nr:hypothetical protein [SAR324 cluster bacterium]